MMVLENRTQVNLVINEGGELMSSAGVTLAKQWFWCKYPDLEMELSRNRPSDTKPQAGRNQETAGSYGIVVRDRILFLNFFLTRTEKHPAIECVP